MATRAVRVPATGGIVQIVEGPGVHQLVRFENQAVLDKMRNNGFEDLAKAMGLPKGTKLKVGGVMASFLGCLYYCHSKGAIKSPEHEITWYN